MKEKENHSAKQPVGLTPRRAASGRGIATRLAVCFGSAFVLLLAAVTAIGIVGVPFSGYSGRLGDRKIESFRNLNLIADLKKEQLLRWLEERRDDTHVTAENATVRKNAAFLQTEIRKRSAEGEKNADFWQRLSGMQPYKELRDFLVVIERTYAVYDSIFVSDAETGIILVSTENALLGTHAAETIEGFVPGSTESEIGDINLDARQQRPLFHFRHGIEDDQGRIVADLVLQANPDDILRPILHTGESLGDSGEALLVNRDGLLLTSLKHPLPDGTKAVPLKHRIEAKPAQLAAHWQEGITEARDYRGEPVLAAYRHVRVTSEWGWGMVVKIDRSELYAPLRRDIRYAVFLGLAGAILAVALAVGLARGLTAPIRRLGETAEEVAGGNLSARSSVRTNDEVGFLAGTFNSMLDRVENWHVELESEVASRTEELKTLNLELEDRVRRRTSQLAAANKELEAFAYSVSHDLRAPLRAIHGFSQALWEDYADRFDQTGVDYLDRVKAAARRMGTLIDDLLKLSRLTRGEMKFETVDLTELARQAAAGLREEQPGRSCEIDIAPDLRVEADAGMMRVVLENLLGNAWKFTSKTDGARVEMGVERTESETVYFVRDNGAGFDMTYSKKLFGAFQRLHTEEEFSGTGVGLATVSRIVHRHGGRVWAQGEVDKGATFFFTLGDSPQT